MHVVFIEPAFPRNQPEFVRGLAEVGCHLTGIGEAPAQALPRQIRGWLDDYEQVPSVVHEESLLAAVRRVASRHPVERLEATVEAHVLAAARVREALGLAGTSVETTFLCRDKPAMKEFLRHHGIPCARSTGTDSPEEARRFAAETGYPLIIKPRAAAGAADTWRVDDDAELEAVLTESGVGRGASVAIEEFIEGHEAFYDTLTVGGEIAHEFITHYYPGVLTAMRERSVSPVFIATNRVDAETYQEVKDLGARVIRALGLETSATHMEWFYGPKGLKFSEIGCRPPGVGAWDLYCAGNDLDLYQEWAAAIVHGRVFGKPSRRFAAGIVNLRPNQDGRITGYEGVEEMRQALGEWIIDSHLPPPGTPTQPISAGYMANAWVRLRHPDYDELRRLLELVGQKVKVLAR